MLEDLRQIGRIKRRVQNHPVAALTLLGGAVVIGLGQVAGAFKSLHELLHTASHGGNSEGWEKTGEPRYTSHRRLASTNSKAKGDCLPSFCLSQISSLQCRRTTFSI